MAKEDEDDDDEDDTPILLAFFCSNGDGQNTSVFCTVVDVEMMVRDVEGLLDESDMVSRPNPNPVIRPSNFTTARHHRKQEG